MQYTESKHLMGTDVTITIFGSGDYTLDIDAVFDLFYDMELEFSRFISTSSLSLLNTKRSLLVSDRFIDIIKKCKELYIKTDGYFNPLVSVSQIGYNKSFDLQEFEKKDINVNLDFERVKIDENVVTLDTDQIIDLGGIVKGYTVDLAKNYLDKQGYTNYIIDAGGDIYVSGITDLEKPILVGIDDPFTKGYLSATLELKDKAIATSGNYKRKWTIDNQEYNHIINPLTSSNNNEITSISLIADVCYLADAYATVCIAMGVDKTLEFVKKEHIDAFIVCLDQRTYQTDGMEQYALRIL
ncbi:MAG: FAD:protein FMN transferase [Candidatus Absconditabacteria bacterium]